MIKRSLLATAIASATIASAQASPFLPMDARGLAMGSTGVASAKRAHAPAYNPSLLSQGEHDDDFAILFPQVGLSVADEEEMYDTFIDINDDLVPEFEDLFDDATANNFEDKVDNLGQATEDLQAALEGLTAADVNNANAKISEIRGLNNNVRSALADVRSDLTTVDNLSEQLTSELNSVSGNPLSGRLGVSSALAFPGKEFAAALSFSGNVTFSGRAFFSADDSALLNGYSDAAVAYADEADQLTSDIDAFLADAEAGNVDQDDADTIAAQAEDTSNFTSDTITREDGSSYNLIENGDLSADAEDPDMTSNVEVIALAVADLGVSFSREFSFWDKKVAIGITPKLQRVVTMHYAAEADYDGDIEQEDLEDASETYNHVNLDVGASFRFGASNKWMFGVVGKNLISKSFEVKDAEVKGSTLPRTLEGGEVTLDPQFRAGVAFNGDWTTLALDVDLVENDPIAWENPTQYAAIGAEFDIYNTLQLRLGYRTNMSVSEAEVASIGLGFSPFGVHIDIAAMANPNDPEKEAGVALETGFYF